MPLPNGLTPKQNGFVKDYLETGNGTEAVMKNYDVTSYNAASVIASQNLSKQAVIDVLEGASLNAAKMIETLSMSAESEQVKLASCKDILDRTGHKPIDRSESKVQSDVTLSSSEELLIMANELANKIKDV